MWPLAFTYPSLTFRLTAGNAAFAAIRSCRELLERVLLQCTAVNMRCLLITFKLLAMGFPSASLHSPRSTDRLLAARQSSAGDIPDIAS